jgi:hypothetical protein
MAMRTSIVLASALFAASAMAGELPKEGKFSGTYNAAGTYHGTAMGKDGTANSNDELGFSVGPGIFDHVAWHCYPTFGIFAGKSRFMGLCVGNDLAGDQMMANFESDGVQPMDAKTWQGHSHFIGGTGKYTGITGDWAYTFDPNAFKPAAGENHYFALISYDGAYKLP